MKRLLISTVAAAVLLVGGVTPAFAAANSHASCIGLHGSTEGPEGVVGDEIRFFTQVLKGSGDSLGTFASDEAKLHLQSYEACPE